MKGLIPDTVETEAADKFVFPDKRCIAIGLPPCGDVNGYSSPKCLRCPQPQFSEEAKDRRAQGTALFIVIIDENGRVKGFQNCDSAALRSHSAGGSGYSEMDVSTGNCTEWETGGGSSAN